MLLAEYGLVPKAAYVDARHFCALQRVEMKRFKVKKRWGWGWGWGWEDDGSEMKIAEDVCKAANRQKGNARYKGGVIACCTLNMRPMLHSSAPYTRIRDSY